jgi:alkylation response protein AidB-like acyl-CoA dehydrogenase
MDFTFTDDQIAFRQAVAELLAKECTPDRLREAWAGDGRVPGLWDRLVEMGVIGLLVPEQDGGLGMTELDLVGMVEEVGRAGAPDPVARVAGVIVPLLSEVANEDAVALLPGIAAGSVRPVLRLPGERFVDHVADATVVLVAEGDELLSLDPTAVTASAEPATDGGAQLAELSFDPGQAEVLSPEADAAAAEAAERTTLFTAAELVGLAGRMLDDTVEYAKDRRQFGVPIGSFQAVKHHLANVRKQLEFARPAVYAAAWEVAAQTDTRSRAVSVARVLTGDAAELAAKVGLQVHGAIGYTDEADLHLFMKRVWTLAAQGGTPSQHARRVADQLLA